MARASQETAIFSVGPEKSGACEPLGQPVIWTSTAWDGNANRTNERPQRGMTFLRIVIPLRRFI
jgi:hypothetical protein